jgi:undecaprenyl-diphosphatase
VSIDTTVPPLEIAGAPLARATSCPRERPPLALERDPRQAPLSSPAFMDAFQAIVLGIVQGLTEFLPVSSTGHLRIVPAFLGWEDPGAAFTAVTQLGTMAAVLLYFREDLWRIASTWLRSLRDPSLRGTLDARMGWYIGLGTIPIGLAGLAFNDQIEEGARSLYLIGTTLIVLGLLLLAAEKVARHDRPLEAITRRDAIAIGIAQACALVPGVSRSGATLTAGLFLGFDRTSAARYSFLLSVPAVVLSGLFELRKIGDEGGAGFVATALATLLAFIVGYASIAFLLRWLSTHSTAAFVAYRVALGTLVIALTASGAIS